jgi:hypothetical protein
MSIGPGRPGEIKPPGHPFFVSATENENSQFRRAINELGKGRQLLAIRRPGLTISSCRCSL